MTPFVSELIGTAIIIILGNGVVANVVLHKTYGHAGGWIVITFGWAMAVFVAVYVTAAASGAHLNPAVTIALATVGKFSWTKVPLYIAAQLLGAMLGSLFVWIVYRNHFNETPNPASKQAAFCTSPAIPNTFYNFLSETIATFVFILGALFIVASKNSLGSLDALPVALLVFAIGLSLGGTTGYAISPVRDLGPRIMHAILPIKDKGSSNWQYSWIPIAGPITGCLLASGVYLLLQ